MSKHSGCRPRSNTQVPGSFWLRATASSTASGNTTRNCSGDADGHYDTQDTRLNLELPAAEGGPEAHYARSALMQALQEALEELPEAQREVFIAHELEGKASRS